MADLSLLGTRDIIGTFYDRLNDALGGSWAPMISFFNRVDQETETYKWLGLPPAMRKWTGGRHAVPLGKYSYALTNQKYESTLEFDVDDLRRDKTTQIRTRIAELARRTAYHWESLLNAIIQTGDATTCYDGQYFFDTDHDLSGSNQTNNLTATEIPGANVTTATAPTATEMAKIIVELISYMYTYVDSQGEPLNGDAKKFALMVPVAGTFYSSALHALSADRLASGESNPVKGSGFDISLIPNPRIDWTTEMAIFRLDSDGQRPFIMQEESPVEVQTIGPGSEFEFDNDKHKFGVKAVRTVGYGQWYYGAKVTLS